MEQLEGESIREMLLNRFYKYQAWLKPNPSDTFLIQSLKMIYKVLSVLVLVALSPVIIIILLFVFFAAL